MSRAFNSHDSLARTAEVALAKYCLMDVPMLKQEHDLLISIMELVAHKSGMKVSLRIGDGVITRNGDTR